ncbi:MAG: hypothetical protein K1X74_18420 [Pirellulales bacterium]|nr:hypothetical protein [Pirellulales bacterium]
MHTIDLLAEALAEARRLGYTVRQEWLGGSGSGACEIRGRKLIFLDLAQTPEDHLESVREVLREQPDAVVLKLSPRLVERLRLRPAA